MDVVKGISNTCIVGLQGFLMSGVPALMPRFDSCRQSSKKQEQTNSAAFSLQANYTD
jgi:uncharacterized protein (UPF0297 family)